MKECKTVVGLRIGPDSGGAEGKDLRGRWYMSKNMIQRELDFLTVYHNGLEFIQLLIMS